MENNNMTIIIRSFCLNHPLINAWKYSLKKPIALVFPESRDVSSFIQSISYDLKVITATTKLEKAKEMIWEANSEGIFLMMPEKGNRTSVKMQVLEEVIFRAAMLGEIDGKPVCAAIFMIFLGFIPARYAERVFAIAVNEKSTQVQQDFFRLVPENGDLSLVEDKIAEIMNEEAELNPLLVAVCFLYPKLKKEGKKEEYKRLLDEANTIVENASLYEERDQVRSLAMDRILAFYREEDGRDRIFRLPYLNIEAERMLDSACFVRENDLYFSEKTFRKIMEPLTNSMPMGLLKESLIEAEVLIGNIGDCTCKMSYYGRDNHLSRKRMLRIDMSKFAGNDEFKYLHMSYFIRGE